MSIKTELQGAIDYCNVALQGKGASSASTVYEIGDMIDTIQQGTSDWNLVEITASAQTGTGGDFYTAYLADYADDLPNGYLIVAIPENPSAVNYMMLSTVVYNFNNTKTTLYTRRNGSTSTAQNVNGTGSCVVSRGATIRIYIGKFPMLWTS